jgi:hypothetical protein
MAIARCLVAIVTSAAVFQHDRVSGRDYCDALGVLLGTQAIDAFTAGLQKRLGKLLHWRSPYLGRIERVDNSEAYRILPETGLLIPSVPAAMPAPRTTVKASPALRAKQENQAFLRDECTGTSVTF